MKIKKHILNWILYLGSITILFFLNEYENKKVGLDVIKAMEENRLEIITETKTSILPDGTRIEKIDTVDYRIIVKK